MLQRSHAFFVRWWCVSYLIQFMVVMHMELRSLMCFLQCSDKSSNTPKLFRLSSTCSHMDARGGGCLYSLGLSKHVPVPLCSSGETTGSAKLGSVRDLPVTCLWSMGRLQITGCQPPGRRTPLHGSQLKKCYLTLVMSVEVPLYICGHCRCVLSYLWLV